MDFRKLLEDIIEKKERVLVVGMGISGIETAAFLRRSSIPVVCIERQARDQYQHKSKHYARLTELENSGVAVHFGVDGEQVASLLEGVSLAVVSPGISHESAIYKAFQRRGLALVSELELGVELFRVLQGAECVVVTGSNGKTTTVSFLHHALKSAGIDSVLCGNVGTPVVASLQSLARSDKKRLLVVEASSYQLEACSVFRPKVGILLNLSENHLERHGSMERYLAAKANLFACQNQSDVSIINADDPLVMSLAPRLKGRVLLFGDRSAVERAPEATPFDNECPGAFFDYRPTEGKDRLMLSGASPLDISGTKLSGRHNRYNLAAAALALRELGLSDEAIKQAVETFNPLEHRLELIATPGPVIIVNDSKSTTVAASVAAVKSMREQYPGRPLRVMIGGLAKAGSWEPLMRCLKEDSKFLRPIVCFGQDGNLLARHCAHEALECEVSSTLQEATNLVLERAGKDEVILLSPGCASFDEFSDFEARGDFFKRVVKDFESSR